MKKLSTTMLFVLLALGACKKSGDTVSGDITLTEAANLVAGSLSTNSVGTVAVAGDVMVNSQAMYDLNLACGATKTYSMTHTSAAGTSPSYSYTFGYNYTMNCNASNVPDNVTGTATDSGSFDGTSLSSTSTGAATFRIAGFSPTSSVYVLNGEYKRTGAYTSKVENKTAGTTSVDVVVSNYTVTKLTKVITSGTGTVTVTGTTSKGTTFSFTGTITFTGDGKATVTMNSTAYIVDLVTGVVTKK